MPTTLRRTTITHTSPISEMLKRASGRWPGESSRVLIQKLMEAGDRELAHEAADRRARMERTSRDMSLSIGDLYPSSDDFMEMMRSEWPE